MKVAIRNYELKGRGVRCNLRFFNRKIYGRCVRKGPVGRPSLFEDCELEPPHPAPTSTTAAIVISMCFMPFKA